MAEVLSVSEKYVYLIGQVTAYNVQCITQVSGAISPDVFRKALRRLQVQHGHLRVSFAESELPSFESVDTPIPLEVFDRCDSYQWQDLAIRELNSFFDDGSLPLARVVWLCDEESGQHDIIITVHHVIADGVSIYHLAEGLCYNISAIKQGEENTLQYADQNLEALFPPIDNASQFTEDMFKCVKKGALQADFSDDYEAYETRLLPYRLGKEATIAVLDYAKNNGITVHCLISACALAAMKKHLIEQGQHEQYEDIKYLSPVNLRPLLGRTVSAVELGHYVGCYFGEYAYSQINGDICSLSNEIKSELNDYMSNRKPITYILNQEKLLGKFESVDELVQNIQWRQPVVGVTNIGVAYSDLVYTDLAINAVHIYNCMTRVWSFPFAHMLGLLTFKDQMQLDLMYVAPTITQSKAERFLFLLIKEVMILVQKEINHGTFV